MNVERYINESSFFRGLSRDHHGELARISRRFKDANISMRSVRIIRRATGTSIVAISTERTDEAMELVKDVMIS